MKLPYAPWRVAGRKWHKLYFYDFSADFTNGRIAQIEKKLSLLTSDYMVKHTTVARKLTRKMCVLILKDEDFLLFKMAIKMEEHEYKGYQDWSTYHPRRSGWRGTYCRTSKNPSPMAE